MLNRRSMSVAALAMVCGSGCIGTITQDSGGAASDSPQANTPGRLDKGGKPVAAPTGNAPGGSAPPGAGPGMAAGPGMTPGPNAPRRVVPAELRRLNRLEYDNTVRDLMGVDLRPARAFPDDNSNFGFDNNANSLTTSGYLVELYLGAARQLVDAALAAPAARAALIPCDVAGAAARDCVARVVRDFTRRAFRRPPTDDEVRGLTDLAAKHADGPRLEPGLAVAMRAVLVSPSFLFRVENDGADAPGTPGPVSDYELATRLSYFLWSTMPDEPLFQLAADRKLQDPTILDGQVKRMLADGRSRALVDSFASQWLSLRLLDGATPSAKMFVDFNDELRVAMRREAELFFQTFIRENRPVTELVTATDVFVDRRLAKLYGSTLNPAAGVFERTSAIKGRGGLLRQAGWLTLTSKPTRTSAVVRGEWALSHLLCRQPPPPPPGVEGFPTEEATRGMTQAQVLARHRADPACAGCHAMMDPIGLGLENFDPIGRFRDATSDGVAIQAAGTMPDGRSFGGVDDLLKIVGQDPGLGRCVAEKFATYALGRGPLPNDEPYYQDMDREVGAGPRRMADLISSLVRSDLLRKRSAQSQGK